LKRAAATDARQDVFASLMLSYAAGDRIPMEDTLRSFPIMLRTVKEFASEVIGTQVPA
jgi:hypothetical protein